MVCAFATSSCRLSSWIWFCRFCLTVLSLDAARSSLRRAISASSAVTVVLVPDVAVAAAISAFLAVICASLVAMSPLRAAMSASRPGSLASIVLICWLRVVTLCSARRRSSSALTTAAVAAAALVSAVLAAVSSAGRAARAAASLSSAAITRASAASP